MDKAIAAAAIERLEAEKRRRIDEKVARGEAVRVTLPVIVIGADEALENNKAAMLAELRAAGETREVVFGLNDISVITTGVPRADDEAPPIAEADKAPGVEDDFGARRRVSEALLAVDRPMPTTPPPASSSVEPAELVEHRIQVQVAPPTETDPGTIVEGSYTLAGNGVVRVYDVERNLLGTDHLPPGADAGAAATVARSILRAKKSPDPFWNPIPYA
jgi:hypothetical protein